MNERDWIGRIKIWLKKLTGEFEKEEQEKKSAERKRELEMVYERIKDIPFTEWSLIIIEPDPYKKKMREMYEANRKLPLYRLFDDGSFGDSLKEYEYSLRVNTKDVGAVFRADNLGTLHNIGGVLHYRLGEAEPKKEDIVLNTKISLLGKGFADFVNSGQDVFVRDDAEGRIIGFFNELGRHLIPMKQSDFLSGQRPLPLFISK